MCSVCKLCARRRPKARAILEHKKVPCFFPTGTACTACTGFTADTRSGSLTYAPHSSQPESLDWYLSKPSEARVPGTNTVTWALSTMAHHRTPFSRGAIETVNETDLTIAQERLSRFAFIGIVEDFERSIRLLSHTFDLKILTFKTEICPITLFKAWHALADDESYNCAQNSSRSGRGTNDFLPLICEVVSSLRKHGSTIAPQVRSILMEENRYDVALHNFSRRVFEDRWSRMVEELGGEPPPFKCARSCPEPTGMCKSQARVVSALWQGNLAQILRVQCAMKCSRDSAT